MIIEDRKGNSTALDELGFMDDRKSLAKLNMLQIASSGISPNNKHSISRNVNIHGQYNTNDLLQ